MEMVDVNFQIHYVNFVPIRQLLIVSDWFVHTFQLGFVHLPEGWVEAGIEFDNVIYQITKFWVLLHSL